MTRYLKSISILITLPLLLSISIEGASFQTRKPKRRRKAAKPMFIKKDKVPNGSWGGDHMMLSVTDDGAALEFACANGQIKEPLVLDSKGWFDVAGVYVQEHPGPVRLGEDNNQSARYTGNVDGEVLTLTIKLSNSGETVGPFTFNLGKKTRIFKCG
jgi:hypothetical protein